MRTFSILIFTLFVFSVATAQTKATLKSFPTNFSTSEYENLKKWNGKIIAFDGIIRQEKISRNNTPFYLLELGENKSIWTTLMFKNKANKTGDSIRVVGYLTKIKDKRPEESYLDDENFMVIAFGLVDFKNENFLFLGGAQIQKKEWIDGKIPTQ
ncbi:hypothetical protein [Croceibacter atlanticus]|uniref:hypothetical protein n=1 Tax=Croceibacter atlanticus TaxID=313588 RepID=UPI002E110BBA|nr:hypothetical protein VVL01_03515 [Croceibacter atlanticus]|tara:strand:- start:333 stop:797 length:465 start_codon:yes stop_codon:yes gene_type:complete